MSELANLLRLAAEALEICAGAVPDVQINPPREWNLEACTEDANDGWCATYALADRLRVHAAAVEASEGAKVPRK